MSLERKNQFIEFKIGSVLENLKLCNIIMKLVAGRQLWHANLSDKNWFGWTGLSENFDLLKPLFHNWTFLYTGNL